MHSWWAAGLLLAYFALVYTLVMHREEMELRQKHGAAFEVYAASVPLFFPRLTVANQATPIKGHFSWAQYNKNREYRATIGFLLWLIGLVVIWRLRHS
jgi:hypothetical protein